MLIRLKPILAFFFCNSLQSKCEEVMSFLPLKYFFLEKNKMYVVQVYDIIDSIRKK